MATVASGAPRRVVVLGGGPAGLAAALGARRRGAAVTLLESSGGAGGWLRSERAPGGFLFEAGCRGLRPTGAAGRAALALAESIGLGLDAPRGALLARAGARYLLHGGALARLPSGLLAALSSPLTASASAWAARELTAAARRPPAGGGAWPPSPAAAAAAPGDDDGWPTGAPGEVNAREDEESVQEFATRRLGAFVGDELLDAAFAGVYAGSAAELSARAVMPGAWRAEAAHGGIARAALAQALAAARVLRGGGAAPPAAAVASPLADAAAAARAVSVSFQDGVGALPEAMVRALRAAECGGHDGDGGRGGGPPADVITHARVVSLAPAPPRAGDGAGLVPRVRVQYESSSGGGGGGRAPSTRLLTTLDADAVVSALPAGALAAALRRGAAAGGAGVPPAAAAAADAAATALAAIPYASVALVSMAWAAGGGRPGLPRPPADGFGYLLSSRERGRPPHSAGAAAEAALSWIARGAVGAPPPLPILGMVWDSRAFPGQAASPSGDARVTVMVGGAGWREAAAGGEGDDALRALARAALAAHVPGGAAARPPDATRVGRAVDAIPQYTRGHTARVRAAAEGAAAAFRGRLFLAGNALRGVGAADALANGLEAGRRAADVVC